jgi:hypothetical protein
LTPGIQLIRISIVIFTQTHIPISAPGKVVMGKEHLPLPGEAAAHLPVLRLIHISELTQENDHA